QTGVLPVGGGGAHLQEPLVGPLLDLDQVGDGDPRPDLGEVRSQRVHGVQGLGHAVGTSLIEPASTKTQRRPPPPGVERRMPDAKASGSWGPTSAYLIS